MKMKPFLIFLSGLLLFNFINAQDSTQILFIGNSITYFNSMPQTFEEISNSKGDLTKVTMYAPGGTGFVNHVNDPNVFAHFRSGIWDYVVLQPGSNESPGYSFPISETLQRAKVLIDSIMFYNPCCKVLYYQIPYGIHGNSPANIVTYNNTMDLILENLSTLADSTSSFFAPVGEAIRTKWNQNPNELYWMGFGDVHPNPKGSYFAACIFYNSIFQKPVHGSFVVSTLPIAVADSIQIYCDSLVLNHFSNWRINTFDQFTNFNFSLFNDSVVFNNHSIHFDSLLWNFGDFTTSNVLNPVHSYSQPGTYLVTLTSFFNGCSQQYQDSVTILLTKTEETTNELISIYPNPVFDILFVSFNNFNTEILIYNLHGQLVMKSNENKIPVYNLQSGKYFLIIEMNNKKIFKSFTKLH